MRWLVRKFKRLLQKYPLMKLLTQQPLAPCAENLVVVKLWEAYLLYHPSRLYQMLSAIAIDKGPLEDKTGSGRIIFRFSEGDWTEKVRALLYENKIPVSVQDAPKRNLTVVGRQPQLR